MKTTKTLTAALITAALICGFTACKKNTPEPPLTATSLENTAWNLVKEENYKKEGDKWILDKTQQHTDIVPIALIQFKNGYLWLLNESHSYGIDPVNKELMIEHSQGRSYIFLLSANELVVDGVPFEGKKHRLFNKKISPLSLAQLKGKWEITALQKYNFDNDKWEDGSFAKGYWIEFGEDGKGKNSKSDNCSYTVNGNIVTIDCIYGECFVAESTADKLVFVHQYKNPKGVYYKETFKRLHKSTIN